MSVFKKILVTTDFSEPATAGIDLAERVAADSDSELVLLHVVATEPPPGLDQKTEDRVMQERRQKARQSLDDLVAARGTGVVTRTVVAVGTPAREILLVAGDESVDLIVIASHGRSALGRVLLGSTAEGVIHKATCPVMVVPFRSVED